MTDQRNPAEYEEINWPQRYSRAVALLNDHVWYESHPKFNVHSKTVDLNLDDYNRVMRALGQPEAPARPGVPLPLSVPFFTFEQWAFTMAYGVSSSAAGQATDARA